MVLMWFCGFEIGVQRGINNASDGCDGKWLRDDCLMVLVRIIAEKLDSIGRIE